MEGVLPDGIVVDSFTEFVKLTEPRLRHALTAMFGTEVGKEMAAESLGYGWEHWDRIRVMANPAGYLYTVGRDRGRRLITRRRPVFLPVDVDCGWRSIVPRRVGSVSDDARPATNSRRIVQNGL